MCTRPFAYTHCFKPIRVFDKLVPCGCCPACLRMKSSRQIDAITGFSLDNSDDKIIFLTLTYSNSNLPLCLVNYDGNFNTISPFNVDRFGDAYLDRVDSFYMTPDRFSFSVSRSSFFDRCSETQVLVPTLSRYDIQLFFKRLRKQYSTYVEKNSLENCPIRYYCVGEYGPQHFRPHYHILLFCKNDIYKWLSCNLHSLWTYGYNYPKRANIGTAKYLAQYVNSTASLPNYLKTPLTRPFSLHSSFFYKKLCEVEKQTVRECEFERLDGYVYNHNGKEATCLYSMSYIDRLFPRPYSFDPRDRQQGFLTLQVFVRLFEYYKVDKCSELADKFLSGTFPSFLSWQLPRYLNVNFDRDKLLRILYKSKFFFKNSKFFFPELDHYSAMEEYYRCILKYYDYVQQKSLANFYLEQKNLMNLSDLTYFDKSLRLIQMYLDTTPHFFKLPFVKHFEGYFERRGVVDPIFGDIIPYSERNFYVQPKSVQSEKTLVSLNDDSQRLYLSLGIDFRDFELFPDISFSREIVAYRSEVKRMLDEDVKHKYFNDFNRMYLSESPLRNFLFN